MSNPEFPITIHIEVDPIFMDEVDEKLIRSVVEAVLAQEGPFDAVEVTVRVTSDKEIQALNRKYRGIDHPTDVLSFAASAQEDESDAFVLPDEISDELGDVVISFPAAMEQAKEYGHDLKRELGWLVVHGLLQLIGYDHDSDASARVMRQQEEQALSALGLRVVG